MIGYPSGQDGAILSSRDFSLGPATSKNKDNFFDVLSHIINPLLTKLVPSRWLDIGLVLLLGVYGPRRTLKSWPISSHLDFKLGQ